MRLTFCPLSINLDASSLFDVNDLYISFFVSNDDALKLKRMGFNMTDHQCKNLIRVKLKLVEHSRGFGIFIDIKPATPGDLYYANKLEIDEITILPRGPIPTYNGETFFVPYLMSLKAHKKEDE